MCRLPSFCLPRSRERGNSILTIIAEKSETSAGTLPLQQTGVVEAEPQAPKYPGGSPAKRAFDLAAWLSGTVVFLEQSVEPSRMENESERASFDRELRVARSVLRRCSHLCFEFACAARGVSELHFPSVNSIRKLTVELRPLIISADALIGSGPISVSEWNGWAQNALNILYTSRGAQDLRAYADSVGSEFLPEKLRELLNTNTVPHVRLDVLLPRFGRLLRTLDIIGELLERDEPMKVAIVVFLAVSEQMRRLIAELDRQHAQTKGEDDFAVVLDSASYMASLELKKVIQHELAGYTAIRPATRIYARTETSYALLSESLQQILMQFAKIVDPEIDPFALFPNFELKLNQSILLREELQMISKLVRAVETEPEPRNIERMNTALSAFMANTVHFLFYKDIETFERFVEEVSIVGERTDLVPLVHRFGAYLETLFGQVSMRAVLEERV